MVLVILPGRGLIYAFEQIFKAREIWPTPFSLKGTVPVPCLPFVSASVPALHSLTCTPIFPINHCLLIHCPNSYLPSQEVFFCLVHSLCERRKTDQVQLIYIPHLEKNAEVRQHLFAFSVYSFQLCILGQSFILAEPLLPPLNRYGLKARFPKSSETINSVSMEVVCSVGKLDFSLAQCHQPLRLGDKKPLQAMQAALGPFSNGKMHSEFQTIALELSIGR